MRVKVQIKIYSTCWIGRGNICRERERKTERYGAWYPTCALTADLSLQTLRADLGAETHTAHSETATESEKLWHFKEKLTHARTYTHKQAVISWEKIHTTLTCLLCVWERRRRATHRCNAKGATEIKLYKITQIKCEFSCGLKTRIFKRALSQLQQTCSCFNFNLRFTKLHPHSW